MEKRRDKKLYYSIGILVMLIVLVLFLFQYQEVRNKFPNLSPYIPNFAPFNVSVTILPPNFPPFLDGINSTIYVCEDTILEYWFNVTDLDDQQLLIQIQPSDSNHPFYVDPSYITNNINTTNVQLFSVNLTKQFATNGISGWLVHQELISAYDGKSIDFVNTNITVIEMNHPPLLETIGVQTVWAQGENSTFYKKVFATDIEDVNQDSPRMNFNISFSGGQKLFNITNAGIMNFSPRNELDLGSITLPITYNVTVCVNDSGINNPHPDVFLRCNQDGSFMYDCETFGLTITNDNRAPRITSYYPNSTSLSASGTDSLYFNITDYDPDGTIPDTRWYVNSVFIEYDNNSAFDEFSYNFGCGVSGLMNIKAESTDGELNDSIIWNVSVSAVACPTPPAGGGSGGGGGGGKTCETKWGCSMWEICQNAKSYLELGLLTGENYRIVKEDCNKNRLDDETCGVQMQNCIDLNGCNITANKPAGFQSCHYTENPSCEDGIKNCHSGGCELLVDCGGPCKACPTCSDGIQNQNELGIDCGGPCPVRCEFKEENPFSSFLNKINIKYTIGIILLLIILVIIYILRIIKQRRIETDAWR